MENKGDIGVTLELNQAEYKKVPLYIRLKHNIRLKKSKKSVILNTKNTDFIDKEIQNIINDNKNLKEYFEKEEENLKEIIKQKTKQKSQIKQHIAEQIIAINENLFKNNDIQTIRNAIKEYINKLKNEYGLKIYNVSLHLDEGDKNTKKINVHIHIIHSNVNLKTGKSFTRELYNLPKLDENKKEIKNKNGEVVKRQDLSALQELAYESFKKHINLKQQQKSKRKHIKWEDYKKIKYIEQYSLKKIVTRAREKIKEKNIEIENIKMEVKEKEEKINICI